nr:hypothetical protein [Nitrosomonas sp.]
RDAGEGRPEAVVQVAADPAALLLDRGDDLPAGGLDGRGERLRPQDLAQQRRDEVAMLYLKRYQQTLLY